MERRFLALSEALSGMADLAERKRAIERELAEVRHAIEAFHRGRALPVLQAPRIATPCQVSWDSMVGQANVRFCGRCAKSVYNLSALTQSEAAQLLEREAGACIRYYERPDGTLLTADCPVGRQTRRAHRLRATLAVGAAALGLAAVTAAMWPPAPIACKSVDELVMNSYALSGRVVRVEGTLVPGSLKTAGPEAELRFSLASRGVVLPVRYCAPAVPDTLRDSDDRAVDVMVEGKLLEDGTFRATELLVNSPMGARYHTAKDTPTAKTELTEPPSE